MKLASYALTIDAPAEEVWRLLTTGDGLVRWVGPEASAEPIPGGGLRWVHPNGATVVGRFVELVPHRRLVFTYGWEDGRMGVAPGSTTVEIELSEQEGVTTMRRPVPEPRGVSAVPRTPRRCTHPGRGTSR